MAFVTSLFSKIETLIISLIFAMYVMMLLLCAQTDIKIIMIKSNTYRVVSNISYEESICLLKPNDLDETWLFLRNNLNMIFVISYKDN